MGERRRRKEEEKEKEGRKIGRKEGRRRRKEGGEGRRTVSSIPILMCSFSASYSSNFITPSFLLLYLLKYTNIIFKLSTFFFTDPYG